MLELSKDFGKEDGAIFSISWSPDSKYIALAIGKKDVLIRDIERGEIVKILRHKGFLTTIDGVAWSNNGKKIATSEFNKLYIWNAEEPALIYDIKKHKDQIESISWMVGDRFLATGGKDKNLALWDIEKRELLGAVRLKGKIEELSFSPDGQKIGVALDKDVGLIFDAKKLIEEREVFGIALKGHRDSLTSICWDPKSEKIVTGSMDNTAIIWDINSGNILHTLKGHKGRFNRITSVAWHPSGKYIATLSTDNTVRIWDAETGNNIYTSELKNIFDNSVLRWSPDGKFLAITAHRNLLIFSLKI